MSEQRIAFLLGALFLTTVVAIGLVIRKMPLGGEATAIFSRDVEPKAYWLATIVSAALAIIGWYWAFTSE